MKLPPFTTVDFIQNLTLEMMVRGAVLHTSHSVKKGSKPPVVKQVGFQNFITDLFAKKEWKRYQEILTNETTFDSNALLNKYRKNSITRLEGGPTFVKSARDHSKDKRGV